METTINLGALSEIPTTLQNVIAVLNKNMELIEKLSNQQNDNDTEFLNSKQTAEFLGISKTQLYQLTHRGVIPYHKAPNTKYNRFDKAELIAWIKSGDTKRNNLEKEADKIYSKIVINQ